MESRAPEWPTSHSSKKYVAQSNTRGAQAALENLGDLEAAEAHFGEPSMMVHWGG